MKPLKDYISQCESKLDLYDWTNQICDFFEESQILHIDSLDKYPYKLGYDYIYETLRSHDVEKLKDKIEKEFPDEVKHIDVENKDGKYGCMIVKFHHAYLDGLMLETFKKFKRLVQFFGYNMNIGEDNTWLLDSEYPEKCNQEVEELFNYRFFHVTPSCYVESILRNGLRIKEKSKEGYRKYHRRIQLKGCQPKIDKNYWILLNNLKKEEKWMIQNGKRQLY